MKKHKFLVLVESSFEFDAWEFEAGLPIMRWDEASIKVIECYHPDWRDNVVTIEGADGGERQDFDFIRDTKGLLYYFTDVWTKDDLIREMESSSDDVPVGDFWHEVPNYDDQYDCNDPKCLCHVGEAYEG